MRLSPPLLFSQPNRISGIQHPFSNLNVSKLATATYVAETNVVNRVEI
jgi:hypothetical protein